MFIKQRPYASIAERAANATPIGSHSASLQEAKLISVFESYHIVVLSGVNTVKFWDLSD